MNQTTSPPSTFTSTSFLDDMAASRGPTQLSRTLGLQHDRYSQYIGASTDFEPSLIDLSPFDPQDESLLARGTLRRVGPNDTFLLLPEADTPGHGRIVQDADEIDDGIGAVGGREQRIRKAHIGLHGIDLAHAAERLKVACELRAPHRDPHAHPGFGDGAHHMAADEARAAIDGDERPVVECYRHVRIPWSRSSHPQQYTREPNPVKRRLLIDFAGCQSYLRLIKPRWRNW